MRCVVAITPATFTNAAMPSVDRHGPFVFSRNNGLSPVGLNSGDIEKSRAKLAEIYLADNPGSAPPKHWTLHVNRRTVSTALSKLGVPFEVAEAAIGHMKESLEETYNLNSFKIQRRRAFHLWAEELKFILDDPSHSLEAEQNGGRNGRRIGTRLGPECGFR